MTHPFSPTAEDQESTAAVKELLRLETHLGRKGAIKPEHCCLLLPRRILLCRVDKQNQRLTQTIVFYVLSKTDIIINLCLTAF